MTEAETHEDSTILPINLTLLQDVFKV